MQVQRERANAAAFAVCRAIDLDWSDEAIIKRIFFNKLAELIYKVKLAPLGW